MENASKALLMAGGVLIGILILTLAVYLFMSFGAQAEEMHSRTAEHQLTEYNAQYTIYDGREDITIYDIISLANLAKENNNRYSDYSDFEDKYKVEIEFNGNREYQKISEETKQELLKQNIEKDGQMFFRCSVEYHKNGGRVSRVIFKNT